MLRGVFSSKGVISIVEIGVLILKPSVQRPACLCLQLQLLIDLPHSLIRQHHLVVLAKGVNLRNAADEQPARWWGASSEWALARGGMRLGEVVDKCPALGD